MKKDIQQIISDKSMKVTFIRNHSIDNLVGAFYIFHVYSSRCKSVKYIDEMAMKFRKNPETLIIERQLQPHEERDMIYTKSRYSQDREFTL